MSRRSVFAQTQPKSARVLLASGVVCVLFLLFACEEVGVNADRDKQAPMAEMSSETSEDSLVLRVLERWRLLVERDFGSAYDYETPSYRAAFSIGQYQSRFGSDVAWIGARVAEVRMSDDAVKAGVAVDVEFKVLLPGTDTILTDTRRMKEKWLVADGQWWHVSEM